MGARRPSMCFTALPPAWVCCVSSRPHLLPPGPGCKHSDLLKWLHDIPLSKALHLLCSLPILSPENAAIETMTYFQLDHSTLPLPHKKKSWECRVRVELVGNRQLCVFPSQLQFCLAISFNKAWRARWPRWD